ncbi:MarR family winged helix-turn-helix transcriptional regulator [Maritimibacter dapengensis]|uniref:MarR family transcriptional regulator n=1 Tax=Maritimibacter dapengensis TaxID=2836868 RepID=A0ABS6T5K0_9RHOB|nr:MarR family transcriptional regulator [Maritimibacter dapengensis]MBV7379998.1 MarR family transcriptional regulator [Maritimibacter dapengensis]
MQDTLTETTDETTVRMGEIQNSLGFLLRVAQIQTFERFFETLGDYGLKPGEFTVLWVIGLNPGLRQGTIAATLSIKPAHMTKLIGRLAKQGLVARTTPADDRRAVRLTLTDQGRTFVAENKSAFLAQNAFERNQMSPEEMETLIGLLRKLTGREADAS